MNVLYIQKNNAFKAVYLFGVCFEFNCGVFKNAGLFQLNFCSNMDRLNHR